MPVENGVFTPHGDLTLAERQVDFASMNQLVIDQRHHVERKTLPAVRRLATLAATFATVPQADADTVGLALEQALQTTMRYGYKTAQREVRSLRKQRKVEAYSIPDVGHYARTAQEGLTGISKLIRKRAVLTARAIAAKAAAAAGVAADNDLDETDTLTTVIAAATASLHTHVLELVGETLNLGRTAGVLELDQPPVFAVRSEQLDKAMCLAPWSLVNIVGGWKRADEITATDHVLTHAGHYVAPSQINVSAYDGELVLIGLDDRELPVTPDHRILTGRGWIEAGEIRVGDLVVTYSDGETVGEVVSEDFGLGDPPNGVSERCECAILAGVGVRPQGMPVGAVGLDDERADAEVAHVPPDPSLRFVGESELVECESHAGLKRCLGARADVAATRAVPGRLSPARGGAVALPAVGAPDDDRGPAALLGTESADALLGVAELGSASLAGADHREMLLPASDGAVDVPLGVGGRDGERLAASLTGSHGDVRAARTSTTDPIRSGGARVAIRPAAGLLASASHALHPSIVPAKADVAVVRRVRRRRYSGPVFDLTIPGDETFWADGILVHNCSPCGSLHGAIVEVGSPEYFSYMPPAGCLGGGRCRGIYVFGDSIGDVRGPETKPGPQPALPPIPPVRQPRRQAA